MRRRDLIVGLAGLAVAPTASRTQQAGKPVVGFISSGSQEAYTDLVAEFRRGLQARGFVEGRNVAIEYRFAAGWYERLPDLAAELVRLQAAVLVSTGGSSSRAAKNASGTIPHVFLSQDDPVGVGFVASLNRPGGNATGVALQTAELTGKRLEFVRQLVPRGTPIAYLMNRNSREAERFLKELEAAARTLAQEIVVLNASTTAEIDAAFSTMAQRRARALMVGFDAYHFVRRDQIIALAARFKVPTIYDRRNYASSGGLFSYGPDFAAAYRHIGVYAGTILKGEKPADLPVVQPTRFELVLNLKTAEALGIEFPATILALADAVIE